MSSNGARWLLLLPLLPSELTVHTLQVAYGPGLTKALKDASKATAEGVTVLDIGVAHRAQPRPDFPCLQHIFGKLYKLTCIICTEQGIDLQHDNDVDARFFLFGFDTNGATLESQAAEPHRALSLQQVAQTRRSWSHVCVLESETGEELLRGFLRSRSEMQSLPMPAPNTLRLPGGLTMMAEKTPSLRSKASSNSTGSSHYSVAVGGTFDHLHAGHKLLLTMTALALRSDHKPETPTSMRLTIGITGDELLKKKKFIEELEDWDQRQASVKTFLIDLLELIQPNHTLQKTQTFRSSSTQGREVIDFFHSGLQVRYSEIFDPYGPTISDSEITALIISAETRAGGDAVNQKRKEKDWAPLEVFEVGVLDTDADNPQSRSGTVHEDFQNKMSSTEIRSRIHKKRTMASETG